MLFSSNDLSFSANEAFTNRQAQWQAVTASLLGCTLHLADQPEQPDALGGAAFVLGFPHEERSEKEYPDE
ncbi:hypothetical protein [Streptomyces glycanivorans]|uniref:Uncharacterized protein n=1 Tax=Streptomyces glycanivorans TaxID=3033808 RepID=A0ABY9JNP4_9ACTN|nr:hypothetical protein [Streptomyces sp. Alt3]WLQ67632.1 hypothetical protein P8A20_30490 [Streptomyces sp. Alt3]